MPRGSKTLTKGERLSHTSLHTVIAKSAGHRDTLRHLEEIAAIRAWLQEDGAIKKDGEFWLVLKDK